MRIGRVLTAAQIRAGRFQHPDNVFDDDDHVVSGSAAAAHHRLRFFQDQDTVCLKSALAVDRAVFDPRTGLNRDSGRQPRGVQKYLDAVIALDESKTLVLVEELYFSGWHFSPCKQTLTEDTCRHDKLFGCLLLMTFQHDWARCHTASSRPSS